MADIIDQIKKEAAKVEEETRGEHEEALTELKGSAEEARSQVESEAERARRELLQSYGEPLEALGRGIETEKRRRYLPSGVAPPSRYKEFQEEKASLESEREEGLSGIETWAAEELASIKEQLEKGEADIGVSLKTSLGGIKEWEGKETVRLKEAQQEAWEEAKQKWWEEHLAAREEYGGKLEEMRPYEVEGGYDVAAMIEAGWSDEKLKDYGFSKENIKKTHTAIAEREALFDEWSEELPPEAKTRYDELGPVGYSEWVEEENKKVEEFERTHVEIRPGEWYPGSLGDYITTYKDEYILKEDIKDWDPYARAQLIQLGLEGYNKWVGEQTAEAERLEAEYIAYKAIEEKLKPYEKGPEKLFGFIPMRSTVEPLTPHPTYDVGKALVEGAVTPIELEALGYTPEEIEREKVFAEVGAKAYIPFYGTALLTPVLTPAERAAYWGLEAVSLLPVIGWGAKASTVGVRAATIGGRALTIGGTLGRMGIETVKMPAYLARTAIQPRTWGTFAKGFGEAAWYPVRHPLATAKAWGGLATGTRGLPPPVLEALIHPAAKVTVPGIAGERMPAWRGLSMFERPVWPRSKPLFTAEMIKPGYRPVTKLETRVMLKGTVPRITGFAPEEIAKLQIGLPQMRRMAGWRPKPVTGTIEATPTKTATGRMVGEAYDEFAAFAARTKKPVLSYGSRTTELELPHELRIRTAGDLDFSVGASQEEVETLTRMIANKWKISGKGFYEVRVSPQNPTLIETRAVGTKTWHHAVDIHVKPELASYIGEMEGAYGKAFYERPVTFRTPGGGKIEGMALGEQGKRKIASILGWEGGRFLPAEHRIPKDIVDAVVVVHARGNTAAARALAVSYGYTLDDILAGKVMVGGPAGAESILFAPGRFVSPVTIGAVAAGYGIGLAKAPISAAIAPSPFAPRALPSPTVSAGIVGYAPPSAARISPVVSPITSLVPSGGITSVSPRISLPVSKVPSPFVSLFVSPVPSYPISYPPSYPPSKVPSYLVAYPPSYPPFGPPTRPPSYLPSYLPFEPPKKPFDFKFPGGPPRKEEKRPPIKLAEWQQGFIKKTIVLGEPKPVSEYNPVPKGEGSPYDTFRYLGEGEPVPGDADLGWADIDWDEERIRFGGKGLETDVGKRHPSPTKGWSRKKKSREGQFVRV